MKPMVYVDWRPDALLGPDLPTSVDQRIYTAAEFAELAGRPPLHDELDRLNCTEAGLPGHFLCGGCVLHNMPRCLCGCVAPIGASTDPLPAMRVVTDAEHDHCRIGVDLERILGWPGLNAFTGTMSRVAEWLGTPNTSDLRHRVEQVVTQLFYELIQRGALRRDIDGAWRYDGRGR